MRSLSSATIHAFWFAIAIAVSASSLARAEDAAHYQAAGGIAGYIGIVPAEIVKGHPIGHTERVMHGGVPPKPHEHHLIVALFDSSTGARITNANVAVTVFGAGNTMVYGQSHQSPWGSKPAVLPRRPLELMLIANTTTYGGFFELPGRAIYTIQVVVQRPGKTKPVVLNFVYDNSADEQ